MYKRFSYCLILLFLFSCGETGQSIKRALTGEKIKNTDEFLVKKKDPLILPPQFETLPLPKPLTDEIEMEDERIVESLLSIKNDTEEIEAKSEVQKKLEKSILKNLGNN